MRTVVGGTAAIQGGAYFIDRDNLIPWTWIVGLLAILSGVSLVIGFLTPLAGALVAMGTLGIAMAWLPVCSPNLFEGGLTTVFAVTIAAAIVVLGPGAFSLDSRLFGRREIIIPPTRSSRTN